ncbi:MAG: vitamin B12 dependent methionine synthase [bacterium]
MDIPVELDLGALFKRAGIEPDTTEAEGFEWLIQEVHVQASPKAIYKAAFIEAKGVDTVVIDGVEFTSHVLRMNLDKAERVFPYIATCGHELDQIRLPEDDVQAHRWLDVIKAEILRQCLRFLKDLLDHKYMPGRTSTMNPGSGDASVWPIEQQGALFSLFGDVQRLIGVTLTEDFVMIPDKTVSGIRFPTQLDFRSCQICRKEDCPLRRASFNRDLWESLMREH